jgi:hypothetical protein
VIERLRSFAGMVRARIRAAGEREPGGARSWPWSGDFTLRLLTSIVGGILVGGVIGTLVLASLVNTDASLANPDASGSPPPELPQQSTEPALASSTTTTPTLVYASPSQSPTAQLLPTEEPTPAPTQLTGTRAPRALSTLDCHLYWTPELVVSDDVIYISCNNPEYRNGEIWAMDEVRAFSAKTGKLVGTYRYPTGGTVDGLAVNHGIWVSSGPVPAACVGSGCDFNPVVYKMDPATKKVTFTLPGWRLAGDGGGYVWASKPESDDILMRIDPATNKTSQVSWPYVRTEFSCGAVWGLSPTTDSGGDATELARMDPASGDASQTYTVPGTIVGLRRDGQGCWGVTMIPEAGPSAAPTLSPAEQRGTYRYFRVQDSGVQYLGPGFPTDPNGGSLVLLDTTAWISWGSGISESDWTSLQRLDLVTGQLVGPIWALQSLPDFVVDGNSLYSGMIDMADVFEAGGSLWLEIRSDGGVNDVWRLDVPLDALPVPSPSPST